MLPSNRISFLNLLKYEDAATNNFSSVRHLLELTLHATIIAWNNILCRQCLVYAKSRQMKLSINHEIIWMALNHVLNANGDKPSYEIFR